MQRAGMGRQSLAKTGCASKFETIQGPNRDMTEREQMAKAFASQGDMSEKTITFDEIGDGLWAFTAEGDPNSGVIVGDDSVMIVTSAPSWCCVR